MPFRLVYRTADISAVSRSLDSEEIYTSLSVHKSEWHYEINVIIVNEVMFLIKILPLSLRNDKNCWYHFEIGDLSVALVLVLVLLVLLDFVPWIFLVRLTLPDLLDNIIKQNYYN